ncbi:MAG: hypothetical protein N3D10_02715, partial [Candidatus Micrarchaeota archaeon]|nr:hypothetical protein [Candidatus Micrarchaeota archaeon]
LNALNQETKNLNSKYLFFEKELEQAELFLKTLKISTSSSSCPLCKQGLDEKAKDNLIKEYSLKIEEYKKNLKEISAKFSENEKKAKLLQSNLLEAQKVEEQIKEISLPAN